MEASLSSLWHLCRGGKRFHSDGVLRRRINEGYDSIALVGRITIRNRSDLSHPQTNSLSHTGGP